MDSSETIAFEFLKSRFSNIEYEPDGNVPPDFLVEDRIAIEVRRLNQNFIAGHIPRGLEESRIPLWQKVENFLKSLGPPKGNKSFFVFFRFRRPLPEWKELADEIRAKLMTLNITEVNGMKDIFISEKFDLTVFPASNLWKDAFLLGGCIDRDAGGFVLAEVERNLRICIEEKTKKISPYREKYPEWWLLLIDHIAHGLDSLDRDQSRKLIRIDHSWDKIILLNPENPSWFFEA